MRQRSTGQRVEWVREAVYSFRGPFFDSGEHTVHRLDAGHEVAADGAVTPEYLDGGFLGLEPASLATPAGTERPVPVRVHELEVKLDDIDAGFLPLFHLGVVFRRVGVGGDRQL